MSEPAKKSRGRPALPPEQRQTERIAQVETQRDNYFSISAERAQIIQQQAALIEQCESEREAAISAAVAAEREACAIAAQEFCRKGRSPLGPAVAAAIRSRITP